VNDDGKINARDVVHVVNKIIGKDSQNVIEEAMDMNGDGKINARDVVLIVNIIIGKE
jgi:Ca2+-binding EF-hand superfamily protein